MLHRRDLRSSATSGLLCLLGLSTAACGYPSRPQGEPQPEATSSAPAPLAAGPVGEGPSWDDSRDPNSTPPDVEAAPAYAVRTASGLASHVLRPGTGTRHPSARTEVTVNYAGWTTDGELFDSSWQRGEPASFPLNRVIRGWTEGVPLMVEGEIRRFWIPADLAYGDNPGGGRPSGLLVFDIELISIDS